MKSRHLSQIPGVSKYADEILFARSRTASQASLRNRIRDFDWASTPLGDASVWSHPFVSALDLCLGSRMCSCIYWGPEHLVLYNDAYASILGTKHPWALGRAATEVWPEIFDIIGPLMKKTLETGETTGGDDVAIFLNRSGYVEEFYCSFSYAPIVRDDGVIEGVFATLPETSQRVIGERRLVTLQQLGVDIREANSPDETLQIAASVFEENLCDLPFSCLYSWRDDDSVARLIATANIAKDSALSPNVIPMDENTPWSLLLKRALQDDHALVDLDETHGPIPLGAWAIPAKQIIAFPLRPHTEDAPHGLVIAGINPHKSLDEEYLAFFQLAADCIERSLASAFTHEQETERLRVLQHRARAAQESERLRIARDLHDTLLQSIQGLRFLLEAAIERDKAGDDTADALFQNALTAADHAVQEGREVLSLLRSTTGRRESQHERLQQLCREIGGRSAITFHVETQRQDRELAETVWSEAFGFCREAMTNAVRHANASEIIVAVISGDPVRISVTDNGCGMDKTIISTGRAGHYGMTGMRERAEAIGANLSVSSEAGVGTCVELLVPAQHAYGPSAT